MFFCLIGHKKLYKIQSILDHLKFNVFLHIHTGTKHVSTSLSSSGKDRLDLIHTIRAKQVWNENPRTLWKQHRLRLELHNLHW